MCAFYASPIDCPLAPDRNPLFSDTLPLAMGKAAGIVKSLLTHRAIDPIDNPSSRFSGALGVVSL